MKRRLLAVLCLGAALGAAPAAQEAPAPAPAIGQIRAAVREHLEQNLIPWWLDHSVDEEHGGFLLELERDGSVRDGRKMLVSQARQIWTFARLWNAGYREPRLRSACERGFDFLRRHFRDGRHGGWFYQVSRTGQIEDDKKDVYAHAFVIYAAVEHYRAFDDEEALKAAEETFDALERHAKDPAHPGYIEELDRDWTPRGRRARAKTMNTQLHLLEALSELYLVSGKPAHAERLREVLDVLVEQCYQPQQECCLEWFAQDWTPLSEGRAGRMNRSTSYGHNVEMAWLMQRAASALELPPERYREVALKLIDHALRYGWHEEAGALPSRGPLTGETADRKMVWWVQAENMVALDWAYGTTGEPRYLRALGRQVDWVLHRQADSAYGGWWDEVDALGIVTQKRKAHVWHGGYHEVRACLNVATGQWQ